ncbi:LysR family transcriptional regulator [Rhodococcoides yunnanense]|uniref:LysR family transcriptional regulator n=1 Tax=Rhodococcoides yunnanense TaxID=278209 RepID=UPI000933BEA9|nr:LysR family transcriptional regulator [Rhodococcus yunnanensis]
MELRQLRYFEAVVRLGGFTRAAEHLHVAQPAVSAQIRLLEKELGSVLLRRTTRHLSLTHAGELFLVHVQRVLVELDAASDVMEAARSVSRGRVRVGATPITGALRLPQLLATFKARHPGVALVLRSGLIGDLLSELDAGSLDVAIGPSHGEDPRFSASALSDESLVAITSRDCTPSDIRTLSELREHPFVCLPKGSGLHTLLERWAASDNFVPRMEFETYSPASIRELVSAGLGVAVVARSAAASHGPPVRIHSLDSAPAHPPICVFVPRTGHVSAATSAFVALLRSGHT